LKLRKARNNSMLIKGVHKYSDRLVLHRIFPEQGRKYLKKNLLNFKLNRNESAKTVDIATQNRFISTV
jgi:hypothetical protein